MAVTRFYPGQVQDDRYPTRYKVNDDGTISTLQSPPIGDRNQKRINIDNYNSQSGGFPFTNIADAQNEVAKKQRVDIKNLQDTYEQRLADVTSQENTRNSLAEQIANLTRQGGQRFGGSYNSVEYGNQPPANLSADANFGASDLSTRLNFQVSDNDIINDYNTSKLGTLNRIIEDGNSQIAGINSRLEAAQTLYNQLPSGDARAVSAKVAIDQLKSDLASVQGAVTKAGQQVTDFKPITSTDDEGLKQITSFREFAKLPEQRASDQLRQIDPEAYRTAVGLGRQYRQMATQPLGATTTPQTEELRNTLEQEALNQLRLGSTIGAEERRGYEQAIRGAQTARGNIFGLGPAKL